MNSTMNAAQWWIRVIGTRLTGLALCVLAFSLATAQAQVGGPGWIMEKADPVNPAEANRILATRAPALREALKTRELEEPEWGGGSAATEPTPEIVELARGLEHDPKLIFDFVHNHIDYVPTFGSTKGATLTYYDRSGNDFDQASILVALLRASGYAARFQYGTMTFPATGEPLASLVGSPAFTSVLANGGVPCEVVGNNVNVARVWVQATIGGTNYVFDPAMKTYTAAAKTDITSALGYSASDLLASAGGLITADYVQNLNESAIAQKLVAYSTNLVSFLRTQAPNRKLEDLLGRRAIVETNLAAYLTSLPWPTIVTATWEDIPAEYTATLRIQHAGIDVTRNIPEIAGKRLAVTYASGDYRPELRLDGELIASGNSTSYGGINNLVLSVDHPYPARNGTYGDQTTTYAFKSGSTYAIISDFGGTSERLILKRQRESEKAQSQGLSNASEAVMGETLNIIGLTWMRHGNLATLLAGDLSGGMTVTHHRFGRVCQEDSYYIDVGTQISSQMWQSTGASYNALFRSSTMMMSSFEHGVLEQLLGPSIPAVSTVKLLTLANAAGNRIYFANSNNWATVRPQMQNYTTSQLSGMDAAQASGGYAIAPENGRISLGQWSGAGYVTMDKLTNGSTSLGFLIGGQLSGGYGVFRSIVQFPVVLINTVVSFGAEFFSGLGSWASGLFGDIFNGIGRLFSRDPVDMASGSFVHDHTDLALGGGLSFSRQYNSSAPLDQRGMGARWAHNYDIWLRQISDGQVVLGGRQPVDAASALAALYVTGDLLQQDTAQRWVVAALVCKWATAQMTTNAIAIQSGNQVLEHVRLADGSYEPPPGSTSRLLRNGDGTFTLTQRFGTRMNFNASNQVAAVTDVDGNSTTFNYADGRLTGVTSSFGQRLGFEYSGALLNAVTDSAGRRVSYAYDAATNLVGYTDPEGYVWTYSYDSEHHMTVLRNPLGITTASNTYDSLGRVAMQTTPRQGGSNAVYNFLFSGFRNVEADPLTNRTVYYYDERERLRAQENALGHRSSLSYDGEDHLLESIDPRGNQTARAYDRSQNLQWMLNPRNQTIRYLYDSQFRLIEVINPTFHTNRLAYDANHHLISTADPLGHQTAMSHYPNGLVRTKTDTRGTVASFAYDAAGNPTSATITNHPPVTYTHDAVGRLTSLTDQVGATTTFAYDRRGLLTNRTDALGQSTVFRYDAAGRLHSVTDRKGETTSYAYTSSDKVWQITLPDASTITFTYDIRDNRVQMKDALGATTYSYDAANRLVSLTDAQGFTVGYAYDAAGNVTKLMYPGGKSVSYASDELNRLTSVSNWLGQVSVYAYDQAGRLSSCSNFNGSTVHYEYDRADRLVRLENRKSSGDLIASYRFELDANGNRTNILENQPLTSAITAQTNAYTYNSARNRLLSAGDKSYGYDAEGQLTNASGNAYTFDSLHRLVAIGGTNEAQFAYDGRGTRLRATRNGTVTRYIYDAGGNLLAEADASNTITRYYVQGAGLLALITAVGESYTYHYNALGSSVAMTDSAGNLISAYSYDPFGGIVGRIEGIDQPFKFVGRLGVMTEPSGLQHMRARYYDPLVGRFVSEDPIGFQGGQENLYVYVGNNPASQTDPSGLGASLADVIGAVVDTAGMGVSGHQRDWAGLREASELSLLSSMGSMLGKIGMGARELFNMTPWQLKVSLGVSYASALYGAFDTANKISALGYARADYDVSEVEMVNTIISNAEWDRRNNERMNNSLASQRRQGPAPQQK